VVSHGETLDCPHSTALAAVCTLAPCSLHAAHIRPRSGRRKSYRKARLAQSRPHAEAPCYRAPAALRTPACAAPAKRRTADRYSQFMKARPPAERTPWCCPRRSCLPDPGPSAQWCDAMTRSPSWAAKPVPPPWRDRTSSVVRDGDQRQVRQWSAMDSRFISK